MKSKITIDLDENNTPVVLIKYESSEDVRDKMVKRFLEKIGDKDNIKFRYGENNTSIISPE